MKFEAHPAVRVVVASLGVTLTVVSGAAVSRAMTEERKSEPPATVLALSSSEVRHIAVASGDRHVELTRASAGSWRGAGASPEVEGLMPTMEERLFPLQAYRSLQADTSSSEYGLDAPEITFRVEDIQGRAHEIALGAATFTNGGVYARRTNEADRLYLVPRRMMDDLRSLVTGRRVDAPNDLPEKLKEATPKHDPTSWWLRQALDAGAAQEGSHREGAHPDRSHPEASHPEGPHQEGMPQ